jgi:hypothetical protein
MRLARAGADGVNRNLPLAMEAIGAASTLATIRAGGAGGEVKGHVRLLLRGAPRVGCHREKEGSMARRILWVGGLLVLIAVGWYGVVGPAPGALPGTVTVLLDVSYKANGKANIKVRSSNGGPLHRSRGHICYDTVASRCTGDDTTVTWQVSGLRDRHQVKLEAKDPQFCNSNMFYPQTLTATHTTVGPFPPNPPVLKKSNGKYCEFVYDVTVVDDNNTEVGYVDPDIMPHGPGG